MESTLQPLDDFWEASSLDAIRAGEFGAAIASFEDPPPTVPPLAAPGAPIALRRPRDSFQRLLDRRRSSRWWSDRPLTHRQIERTLAATGPRPGGGRVVPEAGGLDVVHVHAFVRRASGPLAGRIVRYDHVRHAVSLLGAVPDDATLRDLFLIDSDSLPQLVLAFVVDLSVATSKYGLRAGRFALQQVGIAQQNVGLRLAHDRLNGCLLGGGLDHEVLALLRLAHTTARYVGAMACGR